MDKKHVVVYPDVRLWSKKASHSFIVVENVHVLTVPSSSIFIPKMSLTTVECMRHFEVKENNYVSILNDCKVKKYHVLAKEKYLSIYFCYLSYMLFVNFTPIVKIY